MEEELTDRFGSDIASVVMEVTDDKSLDKARRKELQIERAQEIAPSGDQAQRVSELVKRGNISLEREAYSEQMMRLMDFRVIVQTTILRLHYKLAL